MNTEATVVTRKKLIEAELRHATAASVREK